MKFPEPIAPPSKSLASLGRTLMKEAAMGKRTAPNDPPSRPGTGC